MGQWEGDLKFEKGSICRDGNQHFAVRPENCVAVTLVVRSLAGVLRGFAIEGRFVPNAGLEIDVR
jgi:hypothetical protein